MDLRKALVDPIWKDHTVGDIYDMINQNGSKTGNWKIAYYPLCGTYREGVWVDFNEPRALVESPMEGGTDFREAPLRYLTKAQ